MAHRRHDEVVPSRHQRAPRRCPKLSDNRFARQDRGSLRTLVVMEAYSQRRHNSTIPQARM